MTMLRVSRLGLAGAVLAACGGGGTGPSGNTGFTASINGQSWSANPLSIQVTTTSGANTVPGTVVITGSQLNGQDYTSIILHLGYVRGPGDYPLGVNAGSNAGGSGTVSELQGGAFRTWYTAFPGDAGTVRITSLTANRIVGSFDFTAPPMIGSSATGTKTVLSGQFNLPLTSPLSTVPANDYGNKVTADIGGPWNGATIVALGSFSPSNILGVGATSDDYSVNLQSLVPITAGTTYPLGTQGFQMTVQRTGTAQSWISGTGSVTVNTIANGRMIGIFNAALAAGSGGSGPLTITNGTFDVLVRTP